MHIHCCSRSIQVKSKLLHIILYLINIYIARFFQFTLVINTNIFCILVLLKVYLTTKKVLFFLFNNTKVSLFKLNTIYYTLYIYIIILLLYLYLILIFILMFRFGATLCIKFKGKFLMSYLYFYQGTIISHLYYTLTKVYVLKYPVSIGFCLL